MTGLVRLVSGGPAAQVDLPAGLRSRLADENERLSRSLRLRQPALEFCGSAVRAQGVAGLIALPGLALEITPTYLADVDSWRSVFMAMLCVGEGIDATIRLEPTRQGESLADQLGRLVRASIERAHSDGMPRQYVERSQRLASIRGRVDLSRLWQRTVDGGGFDCTYTELCDDHPVASLLAWSARVLAELVSLPWLAGELRDLADQLSSADLVQFDGPPIGVEPQYPHLVDAVAIGNLLRHSPHSRALLWSQDAVYIRVLQRVTRWHPSMGHTATPPLDMSLLCQPRGLELLRASVARANAETPRAAV